MQTLEQTSALLPEWTTYQPGEVYDCAIVIEATADGRFTAYARDLPDVRTEGDTLSDTLESARDAIAVSIHSYLESGVEIPWSQPHLPKTEHIVRRLLICGASSPLSNAELLRIAETKQPPQEWYDADEECPFICET